MEFPNDLLHELDAMSFVIGETNEEVSAAHRPVVILTSNNEKELPDAFLRRAVFHYIEFPDHELMTEIVHVHFPDLEASLLDNALRAFYRLRDVAGLKKPPSTSELVDWLGALIAHGLDPDELRSKIPFLGTLIKNERDMALVTSSGRA